MLFFTGVCEAQIPDPGHIINIGDGGRTGSSDPGQTDPGYNYPPPGTEQPPEPSIPEPSTASLLLFGLTAALALRRRS
jgi:hypothetical protein